MQESSFRGFRSFVAFKDDFSKYRRVFYEKESEVVEKLKQFLAETKTMGHTVRELLTDGGGEYESKEVAEILHQYGISHRMIMPYTPEQNGVAERDNRTLMEAARSMMQSTKLSQKLWAEAVNTSCYILNRTGPTKIDGVTPYELWTGKQAPIDHLRIFGTECFVHVPKQKRQKLDAKATKGNLVGYSGNKDGYRVYVPDKSDKLNLKQKTIQSVKVISQIKMQLSIRYRYCAVSARSNDLLNMMIMPCLLGMRSLNRTWKLWRRLTQNNRRQQWTKK
jgi:hypothetical protein